MKNIERRIIMEPNRMIEEVKVNVVVLTNDLVSFLQLIPTQKTISIYQCEVDKWSVSY